MSPHPRFCFVIPSALLFLVSPTLCAEEPAVSQTARWPEEMDANNDGKLQKGETAMEASRPGHRAAREFLDEHRNDSEFALCGLVLMEPDILLGDPVLARRPLGSGEAAAIIQFLCSNPRWDVLDYPGPAAGVINGVWERAASKGFARRRIFDTRLALSLRYHRVTAPATADEKDFGEFGFERVWNPLGEHRET